MDDKSRREGVSSRAENSGRRAQRARGTSKAPEIAWKSSLEEEDSHKRYSALVSAAMRATCSKTKGSGFLLAI